MKTPSRRRNPKGSPNDSVAAEFCTAIRALGDYAHVTVRAKRGLLYVYDDDTEDAVALLALALLGSALPRFTDSGLDLSGK